MRPCSPKLASSRPDASRRYSASSRDAMTPPSACRWIGPTKPETVPPFAQAGSRSVGALHAVPAARPISPSMPRIRIALSPWIAVVSSARSTWSSRPPRRNCQPRSRIGPSPCPASGARIVMSPEHHTCAQWPFRWNKLRFPIDRQVSGADPRRASPSDPFSGTPHPFRPSPVARFPDVLLDTVSCPC